MSGTMSGTASWFASPISSVSAHYGIGLNGEVHQYVKDDKSAWSNGRVNNPTAKIVLDNLNINQNKISLSIEHEGQDLSKAPEIQLKTSAELIKTLAMKWNIPINRQHIIGHYEIFAGKPNCPSTDKSVIDKIITLANGIDELVSVKVPKSKLAKAEAFLSNL